MPSSPALQISTLDSQSSTNNRNSNELLYTSSATNSDDDLVVARGPDISVSSRVAPPPIITTASIVNTTPRTPNRVRFALDDDTVEAAVGLEPEDDEDDDEDDAWENHDYARPDDADGRAPLLTGMMAPSVAFANDLDDDDDLMGHHRPKSGFFSAFVNMSNSIIGAGIIGQPYAFRQAGLGAGVFLLVSLTVVVDWTINLIVINSKLSGANSFQSTVQACFGKPGLIAISVAQWAFAFGGMIAFCIIIGDSIPHVVTAVVPKINEIPILWVLANRKAVIAIYTLGISYPLTLYRDIAKLAKASAFALASMIVIVVTVVTQGFQVPAADRGNFSLPLLTVNDGFFQAIGVISFAFVCHHNSLLIYGSLKTPTIDRFARVTHYSTAISCVMCLLMALSGFLTFRDKTAGNVLNNFPSDNWMVNVARLCFGLNMLTTLPLEAFVCREVMETYFYPDAPFSMKRHLIFSTGLVVSAMSVALVTCDLGVVFELVGATSACALAYILPPLCYIKLATKSRKTYIAGAVAVFGVLVMVISLVQSVLKIIHGGGGEGKCR
ncbi:amino acid transporter [Tricharina praecox]|uniref:amino acid transporter n=1 Tax=Tricharina praecox TaxID=43433 RepID=UPI00222017A8|nr:amino acid transporter [Tricharina praecox]KAI5857137.1 amino acid transporter [Tricharina praecox]